MEKESLTIMQDGTAAAPGPKRTFDLDRERILHAKRQREDGRLIEDLCEAVFFLQAENVKLSEMLKAKKAKTAPTKTPGPQQGDDHAK